MARTNETAKPIIAVRTPKKANYNCVCIECGRAFQANRKTALYCSVYCRVHSTHKQPRIKTKNL